MKALYTVLGLSAGLLLGSFHSTSKIQSLKAEIAIIAADFAECLDEKEAAQAQVQAQTEHQAHCAWISREQIVAVDGAQGHWLQLALDGPGYNLPLLNN
jgi:hypothetical protein